MTVQEEVTEAAQRLTSLLDCRADIPAERSLTDYDIALLWLRIRQQGIDKYLFCTGAIDSLDKFKTFVRNEFLWVYAGFSRETGEPCALGILDDFQGATCKLHYTFFRNNEAIKNKEKYAKAFVDFLFANHTIDCLVLLTPDSFHHSNRLALALGGERLGSLPSIIPVKDGDELVYGESNLYKLVSPHYHPKMRRSIKEVIRYG